MADDDIPPLEDMSEYLKKAKTINDSKEGASGPSDKNTENTKDSSKDKKLQKKSTKEFGGMSKGFFNKPSKKKSAEKGRQADTLQDVSRPGVPTSMPDLSKLLSDPEMLASFQEPELAEIFRDMSQNPEHIDKYRDNERIQDIISKIDFHGVDPFGGPTVVEQPGDSKTDKPAQSEPTRIPEDHVDIDVEENVNSKKIAKAETGFAGMKKSFLCGNSKKTPNKKNCKSNDSKSPETSGIIKPQQPKGDSLVLPEVQNAMDDDPSMSKFKSTDWVTDNLMKTVESQPDLAKKLMDPAYSKVLQEFQANPEAAKEKYKDNADIQLFFKGFLGILGEHFSSIPKPPEPVKEADKDFGIKPHSAVDEEVDKVLSGPQVKETLLDPQVQQLITTLKTDPDKGDRMLKTANLDLQKKVKILVDAGLLQVQ